MDKKPWRPKDWVNGWNKEREFDGMCSEAEIFEAGADAMLEALKKGGSLGVYAESVYEGPWIVTGDGKYINISDVVGGEGPRGWLVWIPED